MTFELAEVVTKDNLVHQGIFAPPSPVRPDSAGKAGKRAILWVHGLSGRFYGDVKVMNAFADACNQKGFGFASFNNRGHDAIAGFKKLDPAEPIGQNYVTIGAGLEKFEESVYDIDAAIQFLADKGYSEVVLVGHSTGANKVCYYAATQKDARVVGIVLAGPISDRYSPTNDKARYEENMTMLKMLRDEGKGEALLTKSLWMPLSADRLWSLIAPNTSEDVFNYGDTENVLTTFEKITKPTLVVLAGNEEHADRLVTDIRKVFDAHAKAKNYRSTIIPDTTHGYSGKETEFVSAVILWVSSL